MMADISICMPYYERATELRASMDSFHRHGYFDGSYVYSVDLSLVDDGSIRQPIESPAFFRDVYGASAIVSRLPEKKEWDNPCVPLNRAVEQSTGKWLLLQSPETVHRVDILYPMMGKARSPEISVLCPVVSRGVKGDLIWRCHPSRPDRLWFCQLISRELWNKAGGCDERFRGGGGCDDRALQYRLEAAGVKWDFLPDEYWAYHLKHEKAFRYEIAGNQDKIEEYYKAPRHIRHPGNLTEEEIIKLGLYNQDIY